MDWAEMFDDVNEDSGIERDPSLIEKTLKLGAYGVTAFLVYKKIKNNPATPYVTKTLTMTSNALGKTFSDIGSENESIMSYLNRGISNAFNDFGKKFATNFSEELAESNTRLFYVNGATSLERMISEANAQVKAAEHLRVRQKISDNLVGKYSAYFDNEEDLYRFENFMTKVVDMKNYYEKDIEEILSKEFKFEDKVIKSVMSDLDLASSKDVLDLYKSEVQQEFKVEGFYEKLLKDISESIIERQGTVDKAKSSIVNMKYASLGDLIKARESGYKVFSDDEFDFVKSLIEQNEEFAKVVADKNVFINDFGQVTDLRLFSAQRREFLKKYSNTLFAKVLHVTDIFNLEDRKLMHVFYKGDILPELSHLKNITTKEGRLKSPIMFIGDKLYDIYDLNNPLDEGYFINSSRYGTKARMRKRMLGLSEERQTRALFWNIDKDSTLGRIFNKFDLGQQEAASVFDELKGMFTKFDNPKWGGSIINNVLFGDPTDKDIFEITSMFDKYTSPLSNKLWLRMLKENEKLINSIGLDYSKLRMRTKDEIEQAMDYLIEQNKKGNKRFTNKRLEWYAMQYKRNKQEFLSRSIPYSNKMPSEWLRNVKTVTGYDVIKREIQREILNAYVGSPSNSKEFEVFIKRLYKTGFIGKKEYQDALRLSTFAKVDDYYFSIKRKTKNDIKHSITKFNEMAKNDADFRESVIEMAKEFYPASQSFVFDESNGKINTRYIPMKKSKTTQMVREMMKKNNQNIKASAVLKQAWKELSAGKHRPQDITGVTQLGYFFFERLNELLTGAGLGLSDKSLYSTGGIIKGLLLKRILPVYGIYTGIRYIDYMTERFTGEGLFSRLYGGWANTRIGLARIGDITGIHNIYKSMYAASPALQYLDENGPMSAEELKEYYATGYDPIRRGRFWGIGSTTPWKGEGIEYWRPTRYRLIKSNYLYTDVMYGSKKEYWQNFWLPTPLHPLSPIRHFITDRYHWENKHYYDRPYPLTSGLVPDDIPFGSLINNTVGQILKPRIIMHGDEWMPSPVGTMTNAINRAIKRISNTRTSSDQGFYTIVPEGNGLKIKQVVPAAVAEPGYRIISLSSYKGEDGKQYTAMSEKPDAIIFGNELTGIKYTTSVEEDVNSLTRALNNAIKKQKSQPKYKYQVETPVIVMPSAIINTSLYRGRDIRDLTDAAKSELVFPNSLSSSLSDLSYSAGEIAGLWGFAAESIFGSEIDKKKYRVATASSMTSFSKRFWDESYGGIGGNISEFFRRIFPKRNPEYQEYNPIRNTMPTWLPKKFLFGDPYRIKLGEARLPGAGYEALNKLHPDMFGYYGAFDRFKILADVAPYSTEYKIWEQIASQTVIDPKLRKEMQKIKKRVSKVKQGIEFYPYMYRYAKLESERVTVAKIIDANTFISYEHPDEPIRLAGVKLKKSNKPLSDFIQEGEVVTIKYAKDKTRKYNKDTYHTVNAVVYKKGRNLNYSLLKEGHAEERDSDRTPAGVEARFGEFQKLFGRFTEFLGHLDTPLNNKLLPIRSAYEAYRRTEVYGKPFKTWSHPIDSYIKPTFEAMLGHGTDGLIKGPLNGALTGAIFGYLFGTFFLGGRGRQAAKIMAAVGGIGSTVNAIRGLFGYTYIPERVRKRREIEEYFDAIKYMKYRSLYTKAKRLALKEEGINVDELINKRNNEYDMQKKIQGYVKRKKMEAYTSFTIDDTERRNIIRSYNKYQKDNKKQKEYSQIGKYTYLALMYREEMLSTMVAIDKNSSWTQIFKALPRREKQYFAEFIEAPQEERKKILRLLPKAEQRIIKMIWKDQDKQSKESFLQKIKYSAGDTFIGDWAGSIDQYIKNARESVSDVIENIKINTRLRNALRNKAVPGALWRGWDSNANIEHTKIKVLKKYGVDISDAGYTKKDLQEARMGSPKAYNITENNGTALKLKLFEMFDRYGFGDIDINVVPNNTGNIEMNFNLTEPSKLTDEHIQQLLNL